MKKNERNLAYFEVVSLRRFLRIMALFCMIMTLPTVQMFAETSNELDVSQQQNKTITGTVVDNAGMSIIGANVVEVGTRNGTITDIDGNFTLNVQNDAVILISYIGYLEQEIVTQGKSNINVVLQEDTKTLDEVVVVGYGTMKKRDLTGAVSSVSAKDIRESSLTPDQALQGRVAGVQVQTSSHAPGGGISVQVRGTSSLSADGQPLYVVDGFPISNEFSSASSVDNNVKLSQNPLTFLDASNIESMEVLKDASSTAIYGARGANGVVLITTKKGKSGKAKISFESSFSANTPSKYLDMLNAEEWGILVNEADNLNGNNPTFTDAEIANMGVGTDWQREVFRNALTQNYKLSISGGTPDLRYLLSGAYTDQQGIVTSTSLKRYNANLNIDANVTKKLEVGANFTFSNTANDMIPTDSKGYGNQTNVVTNILFSWPNIPVRDGDGNYTFFKDYKKGVGGMDNPVYMANEYDIQDNNNRLLGNVYGNYKIIEGLDFRVRVGLDYREWKYNSYYPMESAVAKSNGGAANVTSERTVNFLNENILAYKRDFGEDHQLDAMVGFTNQTENDELFSAKALGFPSDYYKYNNLGIAKTQQTSSARYKWILLSYIGRINYIFKDKYLLTATGRYDGSSKFGKNNKYGFFPSIAIAWRLYEEDFIKNLNIFSNLKLRAGYGSVGNERIGVYRSLSTITTAQDYNSGYVFGGNLVGIAYPSGIPNPDLSWEKTNDINLGLDMGFFDNRVNLSLDVYKKKTQDMLVNVSVARASGYRSVLQNIGSMENKGIDIALRTINVDSKSFNWTTDVTFSLNRNKVLDLGGSKEIFTGWLGGANNSLNGSNAVRLAPGEPVGAFYGVIWDGIWKSQEEINEVGTMKAAKPGDARFRDLNRDGVFNAKDQTYVGDPNPDFTLGFNNSISYKQWTFDLNCYGSFGQDVLNTLHAKNDGATYYGGARRNRWSPTNLEGTSVGAYNGYGAYLSTDNVEDASFFRIQTISLGYNLPVNKLNINWISGVRFTLAADNPYIFTSYSGYDPEINSFGTDNSVKGVDFFGYPASKSIRFGIKFDF